MTLLYEWFADVASDYHRLRRRDLLSFTQIAGEYWHATLVSDHLRHLEYHANKVKEQLWEASLGKLDVAFPMPLEWQSNKTT